MVWNRADGRSRTPAEKDTGWDRADSASSTPAEKEGAAPAARTRFQGVFNSSGMI